MLYRFLRRDICWLEAPGFPREGGTCAGFGAATCLGAATVEAAVVAVLMGTLTSSSDSPEEESSPPMSKDSMFCAMVIVVGF